MKNFYLKNKKSITLFGLIFLYLFVYDLFLIAHINDLNNVKRIEDIYYLYELHPLLPLSRLIYNLFPVQYFDRIGIKEVTLTFTYIVNSLSIFEIIFLVLLLYNLSLFLFKRDKINTLTFVMVLLQFIVFIFHISYSLIKIFNSLVFVNYPVNIAMNGIRTISIIVLVCDLCILLSTLTTLYIFIRKQK